MRKANQSGGETATCYSAIDMKEKRVQKSLYWNFIFQ